MLLEVQGSAGVNFTEAGLVWAGSALCISHPPGSRGKLRNVLLVMAEAPEGPWKQKRPTKA